MREQKSVEVNPDNRREADIPDPETAAPKHALAHLAGAPDDLLLSVADAARLLGIGVSTLWRYVAAGRLATVKLAPRCTRLRLRDIRAL